ncbi:MAG: ABC transporter ATP-binding protein [Blastopirellula sp. JB062]
MIRLENVAKRYSRQGHTIEALNCESLSIDAGEYVAIVGPSGSGKTTLLSTLGGMLAPSTGRVLLNDVSLYEQTAAGRSAIRGTQMGFVFQTFNLIPYLTALQNVQIPLSLQGVAAAEQQARAAAILDRFGLSQRLHHRPTELSVGQQQRVALARTLINDPQLILADEPTGNLDPASREVVLQAFDQCHAEGRTLVVVTHDMDVARRASRQMTLIDGTIVESESIVLDRSLRQSA